MKKIIASIGEATNDKLRYLCALLSPEYRIPIICVLLLLGTIVNFYFMFSTIRNWDKTYKTENTHIRHIEPVEIKTQSSFEEPQNSTDYEEEKEFHEEGG